MSFNNTQPLSLFELTKDSAYHYLAVLRSIWPIIIVVALVKNIVFYAELWISRLYVNEILWLVFFIFIVFGITLLLQQTQKVLNQQPTESIEKSVCEAYRLFPKVLLTAFLIIFLVIGTLLLGRSLVIFLALKSDTLTLIVFFILGLFLFAEILYCFFVIPLIVIDKEKIWKAFVESGEFVGQSMKHIIFVYFMMVVMIILVAPYTLHYSWLREHYLNIPFDLLVFTLFLPWLLNLVIFTMRDLQLRNRKEEED